MPIKMTKLPSLKRLNELLDYNPETGKLRWKVAHGPMKAGSLANNVHTNKNGRQDYRIMIDGKYYVSTRIIWMLHHGTDPGNLTIDHINRDTLDNRIANLRLANMHQQNTNQCRTVNTTATRYIGLVMHSNKNYNRRPRWEGIIWINSRSYHFGSVAVDSIDDPAPEWLVSRARYICELRDVQHASSDYIISESKRLRQSSHEVLSE